MLRLERINGKNVWDILELKVSEEQKTFVASNDVSIIEAYTSITGNGQVFPFGIYESAVPIGFLMIGFGADDCWDDAPAIAHGSYDLRRLMIDAKYQGKGYGKEALKLALECIRTFPCGKADYCWLSYEPENEAARNSSERKTCEIGKHMRRSLLRTLFGNFEKLGKLRQSEENAHT